MQSRLTRLALAPALASALFLASSSENASADAAPSADPAPPAAVEPAPEPVAPVYDMNFVEGSTTTITFGPFKIVINTIKCIESGNECRHTPAGFELK